MLAVVAAAADVVDDHGGVGVIPTDLQPRRPRGNFGQVKEEQKNERVLFLAGASKPLETFFSYYMESDPKQKVKQFLRKLRLYSRNVCEK